jgi:hypothetical protein
MDLIEAYYAVAQHLQEQADLKMRTAEMLAKMADNMSEVRMREKQPAPAACNCGKPVCVPEHEWKHAGDCPAFTFPAFMIVCSICGNKRCPHAANPDFECTNSNEPGQIGTLTRGAHRND